MSGVTDDRSTYRRLRAEHAALREEVEEAAEQINAIVGGRSYEGGRAADVEQALKRTSGAVGAARAACGVSRVPTSPVAVRSLASYLSFGKRKTAMPAPARPELQPGRLYRTRDLLAWGSNAPRLAARLVEEGALVRLAHGLFLHPRRGKFGPAPPNDAELMRAFLDGAPFVFTGPSRWNALGLGTTALFALPLVYNTKRSGTFELGGRRFVLRRVAFPLDPPAEWFVVDLLENASAVGGSAPDLERRLASSLAAGAFDPETLLEQAARYGTRGTRALVGRAVAAAAQ